MIEVLTGLGYSIVGLAVIVGIGMVILASLGNVVGGTPNTTIQTIIGYLGTSSGGLASWIPVVIVLVIGMLFLGMFLARKGKKH